MSDRGVLGRIATRRRPQQAGAGGVVERIRANDTTPAPQRARPVRATGPIDPGWLAVPTDEPELPPDDEATATATATIPTRAPTPPPLAEVSSQPHIDTDAPTVVDAAEPIGGAAAGEHRETGLLGARPVGVEDLGEQVYQVPPSPMAARRPPAAASQPLAPIPPDRMPRRDPSQGIFGSAVATESRQTGRGWPSPTMIAVGLFAGAALITTLFLIVF